MGDTWTKHCSCLHSDRTMGSWHYMPRNSVFDPVGLRKAPVLPCANLYRLKTRLFYIKMAMLIYQVLINKMASRIVVHPKRPKCVTSIKNIRGTTRAYQPFHNRKGSKIFYRK